ncbi:hypothetical protein P3T37_001096 [Kitasatospora sp. MAA4]|nr:hypothetical protein [Kitasatospora sp. MAA4]
MSAECAECVRLSKQEQAAILIGDRSRRSDVRVMRRRHLEAQHSEQCERILADYPSFS